MANTPQDRALLWKIDLYLVPWLCLLYLVSFLDRTNIGNARIMGLEADTGITPGQYNLALAIFFISYCECLQRSNQRH